ncbi:MAG: hypothetical protein LBB98_09935 [Treponema sp.]|jgi:putative transposase|nr:hypothetical protein [Treponema sp.]
MGTGSSGENPQGSGKKGTKCRVAVESPGLPIGIVVSGATRHDVKLWISTVHPEGMNIWLDAGYGGAQKLVEGIGYKGHIRGRGEDPGLVARRWVVEVYHSWMNRLRKLLVRCEKKAGNYRALVEFACAVIVWRNLISVHPGIIPG